MQLVTCISKLGKLFHMIFLKNSKVKDLICHSKTGSFMDHV